MAETFWGAVAVRIRLWGTRLLTFDGEIQDLREQFYVNLRSQLIRIEATSPPESAPLLRVRLLLDPSRLPRWSECYEVEQLMVGLFDDETLRMELGVRLLESRAKLRGELQRHYDRAAADPAITTAQRRVLLARVLDDLQWRYTVQEGKRRFSKSLTTRTSVAFLVALTTFGAMAAFAYFKRWDFAPGDLRLLGVAGIAGAWGASFSMLTGLRARIEKSAIYDLNVMRAITMLTARVLVGAGAACVMYLFFFSGFLSGTAFPDLTTCGANTVGCRLELPTVALLAIWCFIAGFSEKLVTDLLAKAEAKVDTQSTPADRKGEPPSGRLPRIPLTTPPTIVVPGSSPKPAGEVKVVPPR